MKNKISLGITMLFSFVLGGLCMYYFSYSHRIVVTENDNGKLGAINFNNMLPVAERNIIRLDLDKECLTKSEEKCREYNK